MYSTRWVQRPRAFPTFPRQEVPSRGAKCLSNSSRASEEAPMEAHHPAIAWTRTLLTLSDDCGQRFPEEWKVVEQWVQTIQGTPVSYEVEPAGAPRLDASDD